MLAVLFTQCKETTEKAETKKAAQTTAETKGIKYLIDEANSQVYWTGSKLAGSHTGTFNLTKGELFAENGVLTGGNFVLNIASLTNTDLTGEQKTNLEGHLKSPDFFDVANHPASTFAITKATQLKDDPTANYMIYGNLNIKDVTKEIGIKAQIYISGKSLSVSAPKFIINRTDFNMKYGSASFFDNLKDKAISDEVALQIKLKATPAN